MQEGLGLEICLSNLLYSRKWQMLEASSDAADALAWTIGILGGMSCESTSLYRSDVFLFLTCGRA